MGVELAVGSFFNGKRITLSRPRIVGSSTGGLFTCDPDLPVEETVLVVLDPVEVFPATTAVAALVSITLAPPTV